MMSYIGNLKPRIFQQQRNHQVFVKKDFFLRDVGNAYLVHSSLVAVRGVGLAIVEKDYFWRYSFDLLTFPPALINQLVTGNVRGKQKKS